MPALAVSPMLAHAAHVRRAHPPHEARQIRSLARPEHQMPMIIHQAVAENPHSGALPAFLEQFDERFKIPALVKDPHPPIPAVQHVINRLIRQLPHLPRHKLMLSKHCAEKKGVTATYSTA